MFNQKISGESENNLVKVLGVCKKILKTTIDNSKTFLLFLLKSLKYLNVKLVDLYIFILSKHTASKELISKRSGLIRSTLTFINIVLLLSFLANRDVCGNIMSVSTPTVIGKWYNKNARFEIYLTMYSDKDWDIEMNSEYEGRTNLKGNWKCTDGSNKNAEMYVTYGSAPYMNQFIKNNERMEVINRKKTVYGRCNLKSKYDDKDVDKVSLILQSWDNYLTLERR